MKFREKRRTVRVRAREGVDIKTVTCNVCGTPVYLNKHEKHFQTEMHERAVVLKSLRRAGYF